MKYSFFFICDFFMELHRKIVIIIIFFFAVPDARLKQTECFVFNILVTEFIYLLA